MAGPELPGWNTTFEELQEVALHLRANQGKQRDGRICVCGHPMARHDDNAGRVSCTPTRMVCPCGDAAPVIEVSDTRPFLRKTEGPGQRHALMKGVYAVVEKGREWKWVEGMPTCMKCLTEDVPTLPYAIDRSGRFSYTPERINVMLCGECAIEVRGSGLTGV